MTRLIDASKGKFKIRELASADELYTDAHGVDLLAVPGQEPADPYIVGFAASRDCIEAALRLRYEVFNLELGEGLDASHLTGLDEDPFDAQMSHLVLMDRETERIVGTYRLQTASRGLAGIGLYSAQEFDMAPLAQYFPRAVELGRVCIDADHRSLTALNALFSGVAAFLKFNACEWMFGCCSVTSVDPADGWRALKTLRKRGFLDAEIMLPAQPAFSCGERASENDPALGDGIKIPKLFTTYMRLGAKVVSEPAIDREFGTVDFLVLLNGAEALG